MNSPVRRRGTVASKEMILEKERRELFRRRSSKPLEKKYHERCIDSAKKVLTTKLFLLIYMVLVLVGVPLMRTGVETQPDVKPMAYEHEGYALQGFLARPDESEIAAVQSYPAVIIIP